MPVACREPDHNRGDKSGTHIYHPHETNHAGVVGRLRINRPGVSVYPIGAANRTICDQQASRVDGAHTVSSNWFPTGSLVTVCWGVPGFCKNTSWEPA